MVTVGGPATGLLGQEAPGLGDTGQTDLAGAGVEAEASRDGRSRRRQQWELLGGTEATCGHGSIMAKGCETVSGERSCQT